MVRLVDDTILCPPDDLMFDVQYNSYTSMLVNFHEPPETFGHKMNYNIDYRWIALMLLLIILLY